MYMICGLGNPGRLYEKTRHNLGFCTVDLLAERLGIKFGKLRFIALLGEGAIGGEKVILVKPQTYMNLSGEAIRPLVD
ncbi:MAG: aminoacyl-tRNA hydrolase, partial [Firmicutes bacterium]|nr:aminoacyl-tRNA hydrolase [Bacillota bacterium]